MFTEPQEEHRWLQAFVGNWSVESDCSMGPDQPPVTHRGQLTARMLGGLWLVMEGEMKMSEGDFSSVMSLGYDPESHKFVGTFIVSMMSRMWVYDGTLDAGGRKLILDTTGPRMDQSTGEARYQDIVEKISDDHWTLSSQILGDDGQWTHFMTAHHRRIG